MAFAPPSTREQELELHRRLLEGDPVASADLAEAYLRVLIASLRTAKNRHVHDHYLADAAGDALIALIKNAAAFDPARSKAALPLFSYLRLAAQGDLVNRVQKE